MSRCGSDGITALFVKNLKGGGFWKASIVALHGSIFLVLVYFHSQTTMMVGMRVTSAALSELLMQNVPSSKSVTPMMDKTSTAIPRTKATEYARQTRESVGQTVHAKITSTSAVMTQELIVESTDIYTTVQAFDAISQALNATN